MALLHNNTYIKEDPMPTVYEELIDAIKRHMPMQYEQLDDIQEDDVFLRKLMETVDKLPLTFDLSKGAEQWFNANRDNYKAGTPLAAPEGFVSVVPSEPAPAPEPEPEPEPEPVAAKANGKSKQGRWSEAARAERSEQMKLWQANRKAEKAAAAAAAAPAAAAEPAPEEEKPRRRRLKEPAVEAAVAPEPRGRLPLIEPEPEMSGRLPLVTTPDDGPIVSQSAEIKKIIKPRGKRTPPSSTSRMCQVYAALLENDGLKPDQVCQMMSDRGVEVAVATVRVAKSTIPNFIEAAKLVGHWTD